MAQLLGEVTGGRRKARHAARDVLLLDTPGFEALRDLLRDRVLAAAGCDVVGALGPHVTSEELIGGVTEILAQTDDPWVSRAATLALGRLGKRASGAIRQLLSSDIPRRAADALGQIGPDLDQASVDALEAALGDAVVTSGGSARSVAGGPRIYERPRRTLRCLHIQCPGRLVVGSTCAGGPALALSPYREADAPPSTR